MQLLILPGAIVQAENIAFRMRTIDISVVLQPGNLIAWILVGLIAGFLASMLVRGRSFGCLGNIVVGLLGSFIGGVLASALDLGTNFHFWGSVFISFIGAAILVAFLQLFTGSRTRY
jgi:uncharacterized membrane protein YeaQ/YmgE (transglycosylase-associated protein family)